MPGARWAAELHRPGEAVLAHVAPDPHVGDAEAFADLTDGQIARVIRNPDAMREDRLRRRTASPLRQSVPRSRGSNFPARALALAPVC